MPEPSDLRARILAALTTTPTKHETGRARPFDTHGTEHRYDGTCALCRGEADTLTDAVMAVLDEAFPPPLSLDAHPPGPDELALAKAAFAAAYERDKDKPLRILPPDAVAIRRRAPGERHRYLVEHRDEALANGIPADLIDMLIADAETAQTSEESR